MSKSAMLDLTWHVAPEDQGQAVEVAYAADSEDGLIWRRTTDRSDGTVSYARADAYLLAEGAYQPWNGAANLRALTWHH